MRHQGNGDLRFEATPQQSDERRQQGRVSGGRPSLEAGYTTVDQAENGEYSAKERRGTVRDANHPSRY